jgi:hypothetical protein
MPVLLFALLCFERVVRRWVNKRFVLAIWLAAWMHCLLLVVQNQNFARVPRMLFGFETIGRGVVHQVWRGDWVLVRVFVRRLVAGDWIIKMALRWDRKGPFVLHTRVLQFALLSPHEKHVDSWAKTVLFTPALGLLNVWMSICFIEDF